MLQDDLTVHAVDSPGSAEQLHIPSIEPTATEVHVHVCNVSTTCYTFVCVGLQGRNGGGYYAVVEAPSEHESHTERFPSPLLKATAMDNLAEGYLDEEPPLVSPESRCTYVHVCLHTAHKVT